MPEREKNQTPPAKDRVVPGDLEAPLKPDAAAERATEKAEREYVERAGGDVAPNVPVLGTTESLPVGPNPGPQGEARPSVDIPTYAPPEQAGDVVGVPADTLEPQQGAKMKRLLKAEQALDFLISHQPSGLQVAVQELRAAKARIHRARYQEDGDAEGSLQAACALLGRCGGCLPEEYADASK